MTSNKKYPGFVVAGVCALVLISGCKKKAADAPTSVQSTTPAAAPAVVALALAPASPLKKGIDAMPQIANPATAAQQKINATLKSADADALSMLSDCKSYTRTVSPTMLGPGYFSVWLNESSDCGAYPNVSLSVRVFDLGTGDAVDWTKLVSGAGVKTYSDTGADGKQGAPLALVSPALKAAYLKWDATQDGFSDCKDAFQDDQSFMIWPDAKSGALMVEPFDFPHAVQACANDMTLTLDQAKTLGFNADFLNAVAAAHQQPGADKLTAVPQ